MFYFRVMFFFHTQALSQINCTIAQCSNCQLQPFSDSNKCYVMYVMLYRFSNINGKTYINIIIYYAVLLKRGRLLK